MTSTLKIEDLHVSVGETPILKGVNLEIGQGEIHARLDALGRSEIYETRYAGVWLVTHYNDDEAIVSRFIEITTIPDILKSQTEDMSNALIELAHELGTQDT